MIAAHATVSEPAMTFPTAPPQEGRAGLLSRHRVIAALRGRYHWLVLTASVLGLAGAMLGHSLVPTLYRSVAQIHIAPVIPRVLYDLEENKVMPMFDSYLAAQMELMRSDRAVAGVFNSASWAKFNRADTPEARDQFMAGLTITREKKGGMIEIGYTDADPEAARVGVSTLVESYVQISQEDELRRDSLIMQMLDERRTSLTRELGRLNAFEHKLSDEKGQDAIEHDYDAKVRQIESMQTEMRQLDAVLSQVDASAAFPQQSAPPTPTDPRLLRIQTQRADLEARIVASESRGFGPSHPELLKLRDELAKLNEQWFAARDTVAASGEDPMVRDLLAQAGVKLRNVEQVRAHRKDLQTRLDELNNEIKELARRRMEIANSRKEAENVARRLQETNYRIEQLSVEGRVQGRIEVVNPGSFSLTPANRGNKRQVAAIAGLFGAASGAALVLLTGLIGRGFRGLVDTAGEIAPVKLLGVLPKLPLQPLDVQATIMAAECVHNVRSMLQIGLGQEGKVLCVSGPAQGSGKTSFAVALGLSFSSSGSRVLLVDCDLIGGGLTHRLAEVLPQPARDGERVLAAPQDTPVARAPESEDLSQRWAAAREDSPAARPAPHAPPLEGGAASEADEAKAAEAADRLFEAILRQPVPALDGSRPGPSGTNGSNGHRDHEAAQPAPAVDPEPPLPSRPPLGEMFLLPAEAVTDHGTLLAPAALERVICQARTEFDVVIVDTGPLMGSHATAVAAAAADGVVLVVSEGDDRLMTRRIIERMAHLPSRLLGAVFNRGSIDEVLDVYSASTTKARHRRPTRREMHEAVDTDLRTRIGPLAAAVLACARTHVRGQKSPQPLPVP